MAGVRISCSGSAARTGRRPKESLVPDGKFVIALEQNSPSCTKSSVEVVGDLSRFGRGDRMIAKPRRAQGKGRLTLTIRRKLCGRSDILPAVNPWQVI